MFAAAAAAVIRHAAAVMLIAAMLCRDKSLLALLLLTLAMLFFIHDISSLFLAFDTPCRRYDADMFCRYAIERTSRRMPRSAHASGARRERHVMFICHALMLMLISHIRCHRCRRRQRHCRHTLRRHAALLPFSVTLRCCLASTPLPPATTRLYAAAITLLCCMLHARYATSCHYDLLPLFRFMMRCHAIRCRHAAFRHAAPPPFFDASPLSAAIRAIAAFRYAATSATPLPRCYFFFFFSSRLRRHACRARARCACLPFFAMFVGRYFACR